MRPLSYEPQKTRYISSTGFLLAIVTIILNEERKRAKYFILTPLFRIEDKSIDTSLLISPLAQVHSFKNLTLFFPVAAKRIG